MSEIVHTPESDYSALVSLVVDCPELVALESRLGDFNLFQVLRSEFAELKHSNVLAWLFDPIESHGLDALFLQKWLMRVLHTAPEKFRGEVSPVDIDAWELRGVEVRREWSNIDVLLILKMVSGEVWVVCIENKVNALQRIDQLADYRAVVESEFPQARQRLYVFLTKNSEEPADPFFIPASYHLVHQALVESVAQRRMSIGAEPRVLIDNYVRLLEEKFMNDSDIARMSLKIYLKHRRALDVIFAHRPENIRRWILPLLGELLEARASELGIITGPYSKEHIRFIPTAWDVPGNTHGQGWRPSPRQILFEIEFSSHAPRLAIAAHSPPPEWHSQMRRLAAEHSFPQTKGFEGKDTWVRYYSEFILPFDANSLVDLDEAAASVFRWLVERLAQKDMKQIISIIADMLPALDAHYTSRQAS